MRSEANSGMQHRDLLNGAIAFGWKSQGKKNLMSFNDLATNGDEWPVAKDL